jgi:hypothetical protein
MIAGVFARYCKECGIAGEEVQASIATLGSRMVEGKPRMLRGSPKGEIAATLKEMAGEIAFVAGNHPPADQHLLYGKNLLLVEGAKNWENIHSTLSNVRSSL